MSADTLVQNILRSGSAALGNVHTTLVRPDQTVVPVKLVGSPIRHRDVLTGAVLVLHDVTREQHYVEQLSWQASHDATQITTNTSAPTMASPFLRKPKARQMPS